MAALEPDSLHHIRRLNLIAVAPSRQIKFRREVWLPGRGNRGSPGGAGTA